MSDASREKSVALQRLGVLLVLVGLSVQSSPLPFLVGFAASLAGGVVGLLGFAAAWDAATRGD